MSIALVSGGSRGIGRAIVEAMVEQGWTVAFTYHSDEASARAVAERSGGKARAFVLDLGDRTAAGTLVSEIESSLGPIDALVNNAGRRAQALLAMTNDAEWDATVDVNLNGAFRCCRAVLPQMMSRRRGSIVNVSSLAAVAGVSGQTAYAASKAALLGMTKSLAREVGRRNVRVNAVLPGFVPTDMTSSLPEEIVKGLRSHECLARGTTAADVANLVAFLASERAAAITGQAIVIDAGTTA
jgi:3-oxoacyl-[acyl-carrier protein] reductase